MNTLSDFILNAYRDGVFPMAESADDEGFAFYKPHLRALLPIRDLHIAASLRKSLKKKPYKVTVDKDFENIIRGCAAREDTWINDAIINIFITLHKQGHAHSVECWDHDGNLAGGLYGIAIGSVFCGESMVSFQKDASKIGLVHLCAMLWKCGYTTLDSQFINPNIERFGAYEMPQADYEILIKSEMAKPAVSLKDIEIDHALLEAYLQLWEIRH